MSKLEQFWDQKPLMESIAVAEGRLAAAPMDVYPVLNRALDEDASCYVLSNFKPDSYQSSYLLNSARNMAVFAVRDNDPSWLRYGLLALISEGVSHDPRETLIDLCLLNNSANKIGCDFGALVNGVIDTATLNMADFISGFVGRPSETKSLSSFGYKEVIRGGGFDYKRDW